MITVGLIMVAPFALVLLFAIGYNIAELFMDLNWMGRGILVAFLLFIAGLIVLGTSV